jgi:hypothetical protein
MSLPFIFDFLQCFIRGVNYRFATVVKSIYMFLMNHAYKSNDSSAQRTFMGAGGTAVRIAQPIGIDIMVSKLAAHGLARQPLSATSAAEQSQPETTRTTAAAHRSTTLAPPAGYHAPFNETVLGDYTRALSDGKESALQHLLADPEGMQNKFKELMTAGTGGAASSVVAEAIHCASTFGTLRRHPEAFAQYFVAGKGELMREELLQKLLEPESVISQPLLPVVHQAAARLLKKNIYLHEIRDGSLLAPSATTSAGLHLCYENMGNGALQCWSRAGGLKPPAGTSDPDGATAFRALVAAAQGQPDAKVSQRDINEFRQDLYRHLCVNREMYRQPFADAHLAQMEEDQDDARSPGAAPLPTRLRRLAQGCVQYLYVSGSLLPDPAFFQKTPATSAHEQGLDAYREEMLENGVKKIRSDWYQGVQDVYGPDTEKNTRKVDAFIHGRKAADGNRKREAPDAQRLMESNVYQTAFKKALYGDPPHATEHRGRSLPVPMDVANDMAPAGTALGSAASTLAAIAARVHQATLFPVALGNPLPTPPDTTAGSQAVEFYAQATDTARYVRALQSGLQGWVGYEKARKHAGDPYGILRGVLHHHGQPLPATFTAMLEMAEMQDEGWLDEAALLYHQVQGPAGDGDVNRTEAPALERLRTDFLGALRKQAGTNHAMAHLLAKPANATLHTPYFDGFAIRDAFGKSFDDLLQSPEVSSDPAFSTLEVEQQRELLEAKFAQMGESTQYRIGSPEYSLASVLTRIAKHRAESAPAGSENYEALLTKFQQVEDAWSTDHALYPLHPRLLLAMHMLDSSGVEILSTSRLYEKYNGIKKKAEEHRDRMGDWDPLLWLQSVPARWNADGKQWWAGEDGVKREALLATFDALRTMSFGETRTPPPGLVAEKVWDFAAQVRQANLLGEVLVGDGAAAQMTAVLEWAQQRLLAAFGPAPVFNSKETGRAVLMRYGMSEAQTKRARVYLFLDGSGLSGTTQRLGTPVDEFLARAAASVPLPTRMRVGAQLVTPFDELQRAEEAFNTGLLTDPWVRARAKENLRGTTSLITEARVDAEVRRIAVNYKVETENHRRWMSILDTSVRMIRFVNGGLTIIDGIRDRDIEEVLRGVGSLLLDNGPPSAGRSVSLRRQPTWQRPGTADLHHVTTRFGISTVRVSDHPAYHAGHSDAHPQSSQLHADLPDLSVPDGNVPQEHRSLATRVRNGESGVTWQDHEVVLLANEDRVVPVKHAGGSYHEVDWHTGRRVRHGRLIHRDAASRIFRSDGRLEGGGKSDPDLGRNVDSPHKPVEERLTAIDVERTLKLATDASIHADFSRRFERHFTVINHGSAMMDWEPNGFVRGEEEFKNFMAKTYQASYTFRRLFNQFDKTAGRAGAGWKIEFGAPSSEGRPQANLVTRIIVMPRNLELKTPKFVSVEGQAHRFTKENVALHELLHALTGMDDPQKPASLNARAGLPPDRGPIVYLTDKILHEAGHGIEERVSYYGEDTWKNHVAKYDPRIPADQYDAEFGKRVQSAAADAQAENRHLDKVLDQARPPVSAEVLVEGGAVGDRPTVRQWMQIEPRLRKLPSARAAGRWQELEKHFELKRSDEASNPKVQASMDNVRRLVQRFVSKSATFRALVDNLPETSVDKWTFECDEAVAAAGLAGDKLSGGINRERRQFYLFDDQSIYLSEEGGRPLEFERAVALAFAHHFDELQMSSGSIGKNRGAAVRLADRILQESGYGHPQQLIAERLMPHASVSARQRFLALLTSAKRSAQTEDAYLNSHSPANKLMSTLFNPEMTASDRYRLRRARDIEQGYEAMRYGSKPYEGGFDVEGNIMGHQKSAERDPITGKTYFDIRTHSSWNKVLSITGRAVGPVEFANEFKQYVKYYQPGTPIRLLACETGKGGPFSFAQRFAKAMNVPVKAYTVEVRLIDSPASLEAHAKVFRP